MGSDKARISYSERQQYRAVIQQQGRVTLEADGNEAQVIVGEEMRKEALDFVGPTGTPDNGYEIILPGANLPNFDFAIRPGSMYVGGLRVALPPPVGNGGNIRYRQQPDWIDPPAPQPTPLREFIYLHLQEQEISALEDAELKDVALGGPDTAARLRLIQHIERRATQAHTCADALAAAITQWQAQGLDFDPQTMRLLPRARLRVGFQNLAGPPDLCEPAAQGGYLGAENQLIQVKVTAANRLVWGFDNASFLYRVDEVKPDNRTLTLRPRPVDAPHQPRKDQAVEMLRAVAQLSNGEYVAYADGLVQTLSKAYDPDSQQVELAAVLPANYRPPGGTPRLFVRVWEEELTFTANTPISLGTTGIQVTLQTTAGSPFHVGDTWFFAVRPSTPTEVYPQRYRTGFQSVEGPRQWVCPLAVVAWSNGAGAILEDCRNPFDNLVELTKRKASGCCTVVVRPEDITGSNTLQAIIDRFGDREKVTICLQPGNYYLPAPLRLGPQHSNLTLEGCHDGAVLEAAAGQEKAFGDGLLVLAYANNVTLLRLRFRLPLVPYSIPGGQRSVSSFRMVGGAAAPRLNQLQASIGVRPLHCANLTIRDCLFRFILARETSVFGVGIFAGSECWGLTVENNRFLHDEDYLPNDPFRMLIGYLLAPATNVTSGRNSKALVLLPWLHSATFRNNEFAGLLIAALVYSNAGLVRFEENTVNDCYAGFWLFALRSLQLSSGLRQVALAPGALAPATFLSRSLSAMTFDAVLQFATTLARSYPLPDKFNTRDVIVIEGVQAILRGAEEAEVVDRPLYRRVFTRMLSFWRGEADPEPSAESAAAAAPTETHNMAERWGGRATGLHLRMAVLERTAALQTLGQHGVSLQLHVANNQINALVRQGPSGIGLLVFDTEEDTASTLVMAANRIRTNAGLAPAAFVIFVERCAITGNLILNEAPRDDGDGEEPGASGRPLSLVLYPGSARQVRNKLPDAPVAVTGNVLQGDPVLPPRQAFSPPVPPPMDRWEFLNTVF